MRLQEIIDERYKIKSLLGEGGMAEVYLAEDLITRKEVAVKIIKEDTMKNPVNLTRFEREARAAASLNHQNIVRVINIGTYEGKPYMVNELIKGQTLRNVLNVRGKFSVLEACDIMYQLCSAVIHAHQHGVIHRDIKPQNVYITGDSTVKLGDFGIATFQNASKVTRSEVVVGSVHYLAPEISQGNPASVKSDIYALGITFFELLTGKVPFDDESPGYGRLEAHQGQDAFGSEIQSESPAVHRKDHQQGLRQKSGFPLQERVRDAQGYRSDSARSDHHQQEEFLPEIVR